MVLQLTPPRRKSQDAEVAALGHWRIDAARLMIRKRQALGRGGYGTVMLGELRVQSSRTTQHVAVKQLRSENESMDLRVAFVSPFSLLATLVGTHSMIIRVISVSFEK